MGTLTRSAAEKMVELWNEHWKVGTKATLIDGQGELHASQTAGPARVLESGEPVVLLADWADAPLTNVIPHEPCVKYHTNAVEAVKILSRLAAELDRSMGALAAARAGVSDADLVTLHAQVKTAMEQVRSIGRAKA